MLGMEIIFFSSFNQFYSPQYTWCGKSSFTVVNSLFLCYFPCEPTFIPLCIAILLEL